MIHGETRIVIGFGEDVGTGDIIEKVNPMIDGLTSGLATYDGVFILRNPENCNIIEYTLKDVPVYLLKKLKSQYEICMDFNEMTVRKNIREMVEMETISLRDLEITPFIVDSSNFNTHIIKFQDKSGKSLVVCGDFKNYNGYSHDRFNVAMSMIKKADIVVIEGKYLGKAGLEYSSGKNVLDNLKNIMKFYKQIFVIQSETDLIMASNVYQAAMKNKKIFIESTYLCNLATAANGSCPTPFNSKKVYSYNPLVLENRDFEFKKKYVAPFYISSSINKMKKEKFVMNITKDFLQDIQVFEKEGTFYDACVIYAQWKGFIEEDKELEEFINELKNFDMDYYELYTHGQVDLPTLQDLIFKLKPEYVIPLDFDNAKKINELYNFKVLNPDEEIEL